MDAIGHRRIHRVLRLTVVGDSNDIGDCWRLRLAAPEGHANQLHNYNTSDEASAPQKAFAGRFLRGARTGNSIVLADRPFDGGYESVTPPGKSFDEGRTVGGIAKRFAQPFDGCIQAGLEINKSVLVPECGA